MSRRLRILSHIPERYLVPVVEAYPDAEIIPIAFDEVLSEELEAEVLVTQPFRTPNLDQALARGVRWVHVYGTGVNNFPLDAIGDRLMTCSRGAAARAISEWVIAVMLAAEKQLPESWISEPPTPPARWNIARLGTLQGKKLALVGFGAIAEAVARRALPFEMRIEAFRRRNAPSGTEGVRIVTSLAELFEDADHIVVAAPETPATRGMLDDEAFGLMKPGVHLTNIARGGLVDQDALKRALDSEQVGLASLDCVDPEPLPAEHWLYRHPRVRLSPHISWSVTGAYAGSVDPFIEQVGRYLAGEPLLDPVDPKQGY